MTVCKLYICDIAKEIGLETTNVLAYRPTGKRVKTEILKRLDVLEENKSLNIDFTNVEICDVSFVDEVIIEAQLYLAKTQQSKLLFVSNINKGILENLSAAIAVRVQKGEKINILIYDNGVISHLGKLERALEEVFKQLVKTEKITARDIAEYNDIAINSASNRLKKLFNLHLVLRKEIIDSSGKQHVYFLPR